MDDHTEEVMPAMRDLDRKWKQAVKEMTFFGCPMTELRRERLPMLAGMLACESRRLHQKCDVNSKSRDVTQWDT